MKPLSSSCLHIHIQKSRVFMAFQSRSIKQPSSSVDQNSPPSWKLKQEVKRQVESINLSQHVALRAELPHLMGFTPWFRGNPRPPFSRESFLLAVPGPENSFTLQQTYQTLGTNRPESGGGKFENLRHEVQTGLGNAYETWTWKTSLNFTCSCAKRA